MKLVKLHREGASHKVALSTDFRLYDDSGEPMKYVKSVSFTVDAAEPTVIMHIDRYVLNDDEIDLEFFDANTTVEAVVDIDPNQLELFPKE